MKQDSSFSLPDFLALCCAIVMLVAFILMPWINFLGTVSTGFRLLSEIQPALQNDVSVLWLILISAVGGSIAALWGLSDPNHRQMAGLGTGLAGAIGVAYYVLFFLQNNAQQNQSLIKVDATGLVGAGFWVALFAALGLVLQVFIPRPSTAAPISDSSPQSSNYIVKKVPWKPFAVLAIGLLATSSASIFIRIAQAEGAPSLVISAWRLVIATLILTPLVLIRHRDDLRALNRNQIGLAALAGLMLTIHFASWITSLEYTSVLISVTLVTTNPLFVAMLSPLLLGEKITQKTVGAVLLALIGGLIITAAGGVGSASKQDSPLFGALLAIVGSVAVALYFIIGRRLRATIPVIPYIWLTYGAGAIGLVILVTLAGQLPMVFQGELSGRAFLFMTLTALLPQLIGHSAYNYALGYLSAAFVSLSVLFEPIGSTILAVFVLNERFTLIQVGGGVAILVALLIASQEERRKEKLLSVEEMPGIT